MTPSLCLFRCQFSKKERPRLDKDHEFMSNSVESFSDNDEDDSAEYVPAFQSSKTSSGQLESSFLELPTLKHVSKAFRIELWFLTHSRGTTFTFAV